MLSSVQATQHARPVIAPHAQAQPRDQKRSAAPRAAGAAATPATEDFVQLGQSPLQVSSVGVGTLAWGDPNKGWGERFGESDVADICSAASAAGVNFYDTAEVYGYQNATSDNSSECLIRRTAMTQAPEGRPVVVGSKYFTIPWTNMLLGGGFRFGAQSMADALDQTLKRLGTDSVDLYQVHFPFPTYPQQVLMDGLRDAFDSGKAKAVAVCNYDKAQLEQAHELLAKHDIPLASNQVAYNLLTRDCERNGLLDACKQMGVTLVAHSPLKEGLLTDFALERQDEAAMKIKPILQLLQLIGQINGQKTIEQTALNYLMCRGAVVIPGAKSVGQLQRNAGAMGWRLDENEVETISERLEASKY